MKQDMVIFTRTYDLLCWLLPRAEKFPRPQRFVVTKRLQDAALDFLERALEANAAMSGKARIVLLKRADGDLDKLRLYLRLTHKWKWISDGQYEHVSRMVAEVGRLLGGWIRSLKQPNKGEAPQGG